MNPAPNQLCQDNMAERGIDSDDSNRMPNESPLAHPHAFSAGAWWVLIAGIATVTAAAVALMS